MEFCRALVANGSSTVGTVVAQPVMGKTLLLLLEKGLLAKLLFVVSHRSVGVGKALRAIFNTCRVESVRDALCQTTFADDIMHLLHTTSELSLASWVLFGISNLLRDSNFRVKFMQTSSTHNTDEREPIVFRAEDLVMKWARIAMSLRLPPSEHEKVPQIGHPITYAPAAFTPATRKAYQLLARCIHVFMGLSDGKEASLRVLESGAFELCVSLLCHPWFEVSYSSLLLLKKIFSERYMSTVGKRLIDQLIKPRRGDVPFLGITFGLGFSLHGPDLSILLTSCESFLRVRDDMAVRSRDPRAEIAFRLLVNLAQDPRCRARLEEMDQWKDNLINEVALLILLIR
jgi:hypothetical protein